MFSDVEIERAGSKDRQLDSDWLKEISSGESYGDHGRRNGGKRGITSKKKKKKGSFNSRQLSITIISLLTSKQYRFIDKIMSKIKKQLMIKVGHYSVSNAVKFKEGSERIIFGNSTYIKQISDKSAKKQLFLAPFLQQNAIFHLYKAAPETTSLTRPVCFQYEMNPLCNITRLQRVWLTNKMLLTAPQCGRLPWHRNATPLETKSMGNEHNVPNTFLLGQPLMHWWQQAAKLAWPPRAGISSKDNWRCRRDNNASSSGLHSCFHSPSGILSVSSTWEEDIPHQQDVLGKTFDWVKGMFSVPTS